MQPVYIVLPTFAVGGAEKRFLGLFSGLAAEHAGLRVVASRKLVGIASQSVEFSRLRELPGRVVTFGEGGGELSKALLRCFRTTPGAVFHYVLVPPPLVQRFPSRRIVFTIPGSGMNLYSFVGRATLYAGALVASRTDFLDQGVHEHFRRRLPFRSSRFSVTPGSYVDTELYSALPAREKLDRVVFLGLFSHEKQAFRLAENLPDVTRGLRELGHSVSWRLHGREPGQGPSLASRLATMPRDVDVTAGFESDPRDALRGAKVFLSLQRNTNYPSKSLLEALACGALPVITDVADSRRMVPDGVAEWVPRDFNARDLADAIARILALTPDEHDRRVALARAHLRSRFSFESMAAYYRRLWDAAGGREPPAVEPRDD